MKAGNKCIAAAAISLVILCAGTALGSASIGLWDTIRVIAAKTFGLAPAGVDARTASIVWNLRFPRALLAFLSGGAFAVSGAVFQSILKNQLASPYILGVSAGASLGAGIVMLTGFALPALGAFTLPLAGLAAGLASVFLVLVFSARLDRGLSNNTVILFGMVFSLFINAILTTLTALYREELRNLLYWQLGSFALKGWPQVGLLLPFLAFIIPALMLFTTEMDILSFGEEQAVSLGVNAKSARITLLALSATLIGGAVALSGAIGFVDLIAPHLARRLLGSAHRRVLPMSFLIGGGLLCAADLIARTAVSPSELPVGAVTALIGAPFFAWVYFRGRR